MTSAQDALKHVLKIMEIEDDTAEFLIAKHILSVRKLAYTSARTYEALMNAEESKLFLVDMEQIIVFQHWFYDQTEANGLMTDDEVVTAFTDDAWLAHFVAYTRSNTLHSDYWTTNKTPKPKVEKHYHHLKDGDDSLELDACQPVQDFDETCAQNSKTKLNSPKPSTSSTEIPKVSLKDHPTTAEKPSDDVIIPLKYLPALPTPPICELTKWEPSNLPHFMPTCEEPLDITAITDSTDGQVIFPDELALTGESLDYVLNINKSSQQIGGLQVSGGGIPKTSTNSTWVITVSRGTGDFVVADMNKDKRFSMSSKVLIPSTPCDSINLETANRRPNSPSCNEGGNAAPFEALTDKELASTDGDIAQCDFLLTVADEVNLMGYKNIGKSTGTHTHVVPTIGIVGIKAPTSTIVAVPKVALVTSDDLAPDPMPIIVTTPLPMVKVFPDIIIGGNTAAMRLSTDLEPDPQGLGIKGGDHIIPLHLQWMMMSIPFGNQPTYDKCKPGSTDDKPSSYACHFQATTTKDAKPAKDDDDGSVDAQDTESNTLNSQEEVTDLDFPSPEQDKATFEYAMRLDVYIFGPYLIMYFEGCIMQLIWNCINAMSSLLCGTGGLSVDGYILWLKKGVPHKSLDYPDAMIRYGNEWSVSLPRV